jgi:hypothetical protein
MAKTLRTSGDYTIKAGAGTAGTNQIDFDSKTVRVRGDLIVDGDQTIVNTATLSVEDTFVELARNNSGAALDAGIYVNRGTAGNNSVFYWDESEDAFKAATTTDGAGVSPLTAATLANIRVAEPVNTSDAVTKNYLDTELAAVTSLDLSITGDNLSTSLVESGDTLTITGGNNINTAVAEPHTVIINLNNDLFNITSIASTSSNINLTLGNTYSYQNFDSSIFQILDNGNQNDLTDPTVVNNVDYAFNDVFLGVHYKFMTGKFTFNPGFSVHKYHATNTQLGTQVTDDFYRVLPDVYALFQMKFCLLFP